MCTTFKPFYRLPDRIVTSGSVSLSVVIVVTNRAADMLLTRNKILLQKYIIIDNLMII